MSGRKELADYWVGDAVLLVKSGRHGTFEGVHSSGKARIRVGNKIILSAPHNILELKEEKKRPAIHLQEEVRKSLDRRSFENTIDLHAEELDSSLVNQAPQMIIQKQVRACKEFIEHAIQLKRTEITIIHGKGKGQLRLEVEHLLGQYDEVVFHSSIHDGGATLVRLK